MTSTLARRHLATAHLALAGWILLSSVIVLATSQEVAPRGNITPLVGPAQWAFWSGWIYVTLTAAVHAFSAQGMRQAASGDAMAMLVLAINHALILLAALRIALQSPESPVYLAGLDGLLAELLTTSLLGSTLSLFTAWRLGKTSAMNTSSRWYWALWPVHLFSALAVIGTLLWVNGSRLG